tara:strand:+ start:23 stop:334 length:312 start_codon:yes stop_codon:yes gene_type:complete
MIKYNTLNDLSKLSFRELKTLETITHSLIQKKLLQNDDKIRDTENSTLRLRNCLESCNYEYWWELTELKKIDVKKIRNIGTITTNEVYKQMAKRGFKFIDEID